MTLPASVLLALGVLVSGCGSGPPGNGEGSADAGEAGELLCGALYCFDLGPELGFTGMNELTAIDVRRDRIYAASSSGDGVVREFELTAVLEPTGAKIGLSDELGDRAPEPRGLSSAPNFAVVGDARLTGPSMVFFDFAIASSAESLDGALIAVAADDVAAATTGPEVVLFAGEFLIASAESSAAGGLLRLYRPTELTEAGATSLSPVVASFDVGPFVEAIFFWQRVIILLERDPGASPRAVFVDLVSSLETGDAAIIDAIALPLTPQAAAFHELADGRIVIASSDASARVGNLRSVGE